MPDDQAVDRLPIDEGMKVVAAGITRDSRRNGDQLPTAASSGSSDGRSSEQMKEKAEGR